MQKQVNAKHFAVLRLNGSGLPASRKLTCVLDNWGPGSEATAHELTSAYSDQMLEHLDASLLPVLWNGTGEHQAAEVSDFSRFTHRLKGRFLPFSGVAFPVRLGAQGNGYVIFMGSYIDLSSALIIDLHGRSCQIMTDILGADERRVLPSESLSDREIACLQMAGDGYISEQIAEKMGPFRSYRKCLSRRSDDEAGFGQPDPGHSQGDPPWLHQLIFDPRNNVGRGWRAVSSPLPLDRT